MPILVFYKIQTEYQLVSVLEAEGVADISSHPQGQYALFDARFPNQVDLFVKYGADVNSNAIEHSTPLLNCFSYLHCYLESVTILVHAGANIESTDDEGNTALLLACEIEMVEIVRFLLEAGADISHVNNNGNTCLMKASRKDFREGMLKLLLESGSDIEARDVNGNTALFYAALNGSFDSILTLLEAGANIHLVDNVKSTPLILHWRLRSKPCKKITELLVKAGCDINARDNSGKTALCYCVERRGRFSEYIAFLTNCV